MPKALCCHVNLATQSQVEMSLQLAPQELDQTDPERQPQPLRNRVKLRPKQTVCWWWQRWQHLNAQLIC